MQRLLYQSLIFLLLLSGLAHGQMALQNEEIPAAPESHVLDLDRVFLGNEKLLAEVSASLLDLKKKQNFDFYQ